MKEENKSKKTNEMQNTQANRVLQMLIYVFALVGVIAVIGFVVYLCVTAFKKPETVIETKTSVADAIEEYSKSDNVSTEEIVSDSKSTADEISVDTTITDTAKDSKEDKDSKTDKIKLNEEAPLIVFLGDSIMDYHRDDNTGVPYLIAKRCGADYINLSVPGICASLADGETDDNSKWTSLSGVGLARAIAGKVDPKKFPDCKAKDLIIANKDAFKETDVFVIEYGINDFLSDRLTSDSDYENSIYSYQGALEDIMKNLLEVAPEAKIMLMSPGYCEFYNKDGESVGNTYSYRNIMGYTLMDYIGKLDCVDDWDNGKMLYDMNIEDGINVYSAQEYLEDGIHLTKAGRDKYADMLGGLMNRVIFKTEEPRP